MNFRLNHIKLLFMYCLNNPLSFLRFTLSILIGKKLYEYFDYSYYLLNDVDYSLSKTWVLNLLPDSFFTLELHDFLLLKSLVLICAVFAAIGLLGRLNLIILVFFSFFLVGMDEGIGIFDHHLSLPSQVILILALVPGSMKISVDYFILNFKSIRQKKIEPLMHDNPKWGINLILMLLVLTYFTAGISKLRYGNGMNWLDGSTLSFYLKERTLKYDNSDVQLLIGDDTITNQDKWKDKFGFIAHTYGNYQTLKNWNNVADYIADNKPLAIALSIGSVLFELLGFIVFFNSKYRNIYLISAILFHLSIGQLMGISFRQYRVICFFLIDWNYILSGILNKFKHYNLATKQVF